MSTLKDWRKGTVDPWIKEGSTFRADVNDFMTSFKATEKLRDDLAETRHKTNSERMAWIMLISGFVGPLIGFILNYFLHPSR